MAFEKKNIRVDYNNMMSARLGAKGFDRSELEAYAPIALSAFDYVAANRGKAMLGWTELPYTDKKIISAIKAKGEEIRKNFKYFVVLGIGGSALGPSAVFNALCHLHYNDLSDEKRGGPKFYVEDNVDPERMNALLDVIELDKTCFNVITKSGATSETMAQYLIIADALKKRGLPLSKHIVATTSETTGNLIKIAKAEKLDLFYIPDGVGGRFSELCPVGLLPAAALGIDISAMLEGASYADERCKNRNLYENPALILALLHYLSMQKGVNVSVMMPYADSLKLMADWYCQLWAESLGKAVTLDGKQANVGQTPVKSLGVTDQHSQVQLYTEGPFDKIVTFLSVDKYRSVRTISEGCAEIPDVAFLGGHTMNELIAAENAATAYALTTAGRLNYTLYLPEVNAFSLGQLMYMLEMQTAFCGALLNIDTFNQPGVEAGKKATYALLGKQGYDEKRAELNAFPKPSDDFIVD